MGYNMSEVWICFLGVTPQAIYNTIWAAVSKNMCKPVKFHFIASKEAIKHRSTIEKKVKAICQEFLNITPEIKFHIVDEQDLEEIFKVPREIARQEKEKGNNAVIDVTPGRKYMSIASLLAALDCDAEKILYLHLKGPSYQGKDYPLIPYPLQELRDLKNEFGR